MSVADSDREDSEEKAEVNRETTLLLGTVSARASDTEDVDGGL
jgi:hypothetical protein